MKSAKMLSSLPLALKATAISFTALLVVSIVSLTLLSSAPRSLLGILVPSVFGLIGAAALCLGLVLATNYKGSTSALANVVKSRRNDSPWLVPLLRRYFRVFGVLFSLTGACFMLVFLLSLIRH